VYPNGDGARVILDYTERYPEWLWQYYLATGDRATLTRLYPVARNVSNFLWHETDQQTGLLTPPPGGDDDNYGLVDWPPVMRYGYDTQGDIRTTSAILAANVYQRVAQMAALTGDANTQAEERHRRAVTVNGINAHLVRADGIYIDGIDPGGAPSPHASQQANAFALTYGIVPAARVQKVGAFVASQGISSGPLDGLQLLDGLATAGRADDAVHVLTDTTDPRWAYIVTHGGTFTWESWKPLDIEGDSMSHGWGASVLVAFQQTFLGVTPASVPSSARGLVLDVRPPPANLASVGGRIPTVAGSIDIAWTRTTGGLTLHIILPPNASAHVTIPGRNLVVGAGSHVISSRAG
jgi:alpha-L-rhamnosidase